MSCYRVLLYDPAKRMHWSPIFVAETSQEAEAKAREFRETFTVVWSKLIHVEGDHWAIEMLERRRVA